MIVNITWGDDNAPVFKALSATDIQYFVYCIYHGLISTNSSVHIIISSKNSTSLNRFVVCFHCERFYRELLKRKNLLFISELRFRDEGVFLNLIFSYTDEFIRLVRFRKDSVNVTVYMEISARMLITARRIKTTNRSCWHWYIS